MTPNPKSEELKLGGQMKRGEEIEIFNEDTLGREICKVWGQFGAHAEAYRDLLARLRVLEEVAEAAKSATCDSHSGMYCEDDSCANKVLPGPLDKLAAFDKEDGK